MFGWLHWLIAWISFCQQKNDIIYYTRYQNWVLFLACESKFKEWKNMQNQTERVFYSPIVHPCWSGIFQGWSSLWPRAPVWGCRGLPAPQLWLRCLKSQQSGEPRGTHITQLEDHVLVCTTASAFMFESPLLCFVCSRWNRWNTWPIVFFLNKNWPIIDQVIKKFTPRCCMSARQLLVCQCVVKNMGIVLERSGLTHSCSTISIDQKYHYTTLNKFWFLNKNQTLEFCMYYYLTKYCQTPD